MDKLFDTEKIKEMFAERKKENPKVDHSFQELGKRIAGEVGPGVWPLFHKFEYTEKMIEAAYLEYQKRKFNYFMWILNKVIKKKK